MLSKVDYPKMGSGQGYAIGPFAIANAVAFWTARLLGADGMFTMDPGFPVLLGCLGSMASAASSLGLARHMATHAGAVALTMRRISPPRSVTGEEVSEGQAPSLADLSSSTLAMAREGLEGSDQGQAKFVAALEQRSNAFQILANALTAGTTGAMDVSVGLLGRDVANRLAAPGSLRARSVIGTSLTDSMISAVLAFVSSCLKCFPAVGMPVHDSAQAGSGLGDGSEFVHGGKPDRVTQPAVANLPLSVFSIARYDNTASDTEHEMLVAILCAMRAELGLPQGEDETRLAMEVIKRRDALLEGGWGLAEVKSGSTTAALQAGSILAMLAGVMKFEWMTKMHSLALSNALSASISQDKLTDEQARNKPLMEFKRQHHAVILTSAFPLLPYVMFWKLLDSQIRNPVLWPLLAEHSAPHILGAYEADCKIISELPVPPVFNAILSSFQWVSGDTPWGSNSHGLTAPSTLACMLGVRGRGLSRAIINASTTFSTGGIERRLSAALALHGVSANVGSTLPDLACEAASALGEYLRSRTGKLSLTAGSLVGAACKWEQWRPRDVLGPTRLCAHPISVGANCCSEPLPSVFGIAVRPAVPTHYTHGTLGLMRMYTGDKPPAVQGLTTLNAGEVRPDMIAIYTNTSQQLRPRIGRGLDPRDYWAVGPMDSLPKELALRAQIGVSYRVPNSPAWWASRMGLSLAQFYREVKANAAAWAHLGTFGADAQPVADKLDALCEKEDGVDAKQLADLVARLEAAWSPAAGCKTAVTSPVIRVFTQNLKTHPTFIGPPAMMLFSADGSLVASVLQQEALSVVDPSIEDPTHDILQMSEADGVLLGVSKSPYRDVSALEVPEAEDLKANN